MKFIYTIMLLMISQLILAQEQTLKSIHVENLELPRVYLLDGVAEATNRTTISAQTSGQVARILFDVDNLVNRGDVIIELKDSQQKAALVQAKAGLKAAEAQRRATQNEYSRIKGVYDKKAVAKSKLDQAVANRNKARANYDAAVAAVNQAEEQLGYTRIKAPYTGIVTERLIEVGEIAQPGQRVMSGISMDKMRINVKVPQNLVQTIRVFQKASVELGEQWIEAEKLTIYPVADQTTNTFKVRLDLPKGTTDIFPGMWVKTAFVTGTHESLVIPLQSVVYRSEVVGVYVINGEGNVRLRHIRPGQKVNDDKIVVLSGLEAGELVALDPVAAVVLLKQQRKERLSHE